MGETTQKKEGMNPNLKKILIILSISLGIVLTMLLSYYVAGSNFFLNRMLVSLEESSMNWRFASKAWTSGAAVVQTGVTQRREKEGYYKKIYIAGIDELALRAYGRYPFNRTVYADMLDHFGSLPPERRPALIFFDILFDTPTEPAIDRHLVESYSNYPGVIGQDILLSSSRDVDFQGTVEQIIQQREIVYRRDSLNYNSPEAQTLRRFELKQSNFDIPANMVKEVFNRRIFPFNIVSPNFTALSPFITFMGAANIDDTSRTIRKKPLIFKAIYYLENPNGSITLTNVYYPDIILTMVCSLLKADVTNILVRPNEIVVRNATYDNKVMDFTIPVDDRFRLAINYKASQDAEYVNFISFADITRAGLPKDAIIMVGAFAQGMAEDLWQSPMGNMYGILHLAYALGTVMNRDFIKEIPRWIDILYVFLLSLGIGMLISRGIRTTLVASLGAIAVPLVVGFVMFQFRMDILMMVPLITALLTLISGVISLLLSEEKE